MKLPIIFNLIGFGIVVLAGILGAVLAGGPVDIEHYRLFDLPIASIGFLLAFGCVALVADVAYRLRRARARDPLLFFDPSGGGQVMLVPVWLIGLASLAWGAYQGTREGLALRDEARILISEIDLPPLFDRGRMEYSADGRVLGVIGYDGKGVRWNPATLERMTGDAPGVSFPENANDLRSEDGQRRVTWNQDRIEVQSASGPPRAIELGPDDCWARCVASVATSRDGAAVAAITGTGDVVVWDAATLTRRALIRPNHRNFFELAFSPDGKTLTTVSGLRLQQWRVGD